MDATTTCFNIMLMSKKTAEVVLVYEKHEHSKLVRQSDDSHIFRQYCGISFSNISTSILQPSRNGIYPYTYARYCVIVNCGKKNGKGFRLLNRQTLCSYSSLSRVAGKHSMEQKNPIVVELRTSSVGSDEALWCIPGKIKSSFTNLPQIER